jgi:hypothetical protein
MIRPYRLALALLTLALLGSLVHNIYSHHRYNASFRQTDAAAFLRIRGDGGFVVLDSQVLQGLFGPRWPSRALYYTCTQWVSRSANENILSHGDLRPLPRGGTPVLEIPREDAAPARFLLYAPDEKRACQLEVDMTLHALTPGQCELLPTRVDRDLPQGGIKW